MLPRLGGIVQRVYLELGTVTRTGQLTSMSLDDESSLVMFWVCDVDIVRVDVG